MKLKRAFAVLLLCFVCPFTVFADELQKPVSLSGEVVAGETRTLRAPFGGVLSDFTVKPGDSVQENTPLFVLETSKVYAPFDGIIGSVNAKEGDDTAFLLERYGAVLWLRPSGKFTIQTTTRSAYDEPENKVIYVGETVYLRGDSEDKRTGSGFISKADEAGFTVEVTEGDLVLSENVSIFRSSDFSAASRIGKGRTVLNADAPVQAEGSIFAMHVKQGDSVKRGDLLFETVLGALDLPFAASKRLSLPYDAVVSAIKVVQGDMVSKGAVMAELIPLENLQMAVTVPQEDLGLIHVGDAVAIEWEGSFADMPDEGTVLSISHQRNEGGSDAEYTAYISLPENTDIRLGMNASIAIPAI